jgi:2'-5' RNA ligase
MPVADNGIPPQLDADEVRNHWWWRPGWKVGRRFYTWHLTFAGQDALHALVAAYQAQLAELPGLDLIPPEWLHLTTQGVGFTDEVSDQDITAIAEAAQRRLAKLSPVRLTFDRAVIRPSGEAIALPPEPADAVRAIRLAVRDAIAEVWGANRVPEAAEGFEPHVSIAYVNAPGTAAPILTALDRVPVASVTVTVEAASLIILRRDNRVYMWKDRTVVPFACQVPHQG